MEIAKALHDLDVEVYGGGVGAWDGMMQLINPDAWFVWLKQLSTDTPMPLYGGTSPAMEQPKDKHLKTSLLVRHRHRAT